MSYFPSRIHDAARDVARKRAGWTRAATIMKALGLGLVVLGALTIAGYVVWLLVPALRAMPVAIQAGLAAMVIGLVLLVAVALRERRASGGE